MRNICAVLLLFTLAIVSGFFIKSVQRISVPQRKFLCSLETKSQKTSFYGPKGHHFNLAVGISKTNQPVDYHVLGKLQLINGTNIIAGFLFDTVKCTRANWLESENLDAYVITLPLDGAPKNIDRQIKNGALLMVNIEVNEGAGNPASLWLTYLAR